MTKFELTLVARTGKPKWDTLSIDKIEADDMIQLICQFNIVIATIMRRQHDAELLAVRMENDDIPF